MKRGDLLSELQLLENVFTGITDSDFMTQDQRNEVLDRLSQIFTKLEKVSEEISLELMPIEVSRRERRITPAFTIGFFASLFGAAVVSAVALLGDVSSFPTIYVIFTFLVSLLLTYGIFTVYRLRESGEEPSARNAMQSAMDFEQEVISTLHKLRIPIFIAERTSGFDMIITLGERRILIEVKAHTRRPPLPYIRNSIERLNHAIKAKNGDEGIIVTKESYQLPNELLRNTKIRIMTLRELRNYLVHDSTK